ncbi:MAG: hypothetical protein ACJAW3_001319 [Lentimonas sp.]|jgi:hypothetical protein
MKLKKWYYRNFGTISQKQAESWGLKFYRNIYGDEINRLNCRSHWEDELGRLYSVIELYYN